jgi:tetratricopeptide (TPR) repeat protein
MKLALSEFTEAIDLDTHYAAAYASRSLVQSGLARNYSNTTERRDTLEKARADATHAITLNTNFALAHLALADVLESTLDYLSANTEFAHAMALEPGNTELLRKYGQFEVLMGHADIGLETLQRLITLDPLNDSNYFVLGVSLIWAHRPDEAISYLNQAKSLAPNDRSIYGWLGYAYLTKRDYEHAKEACERTVDSNRIHCLAMAYDGLGQRAEANRLLAQFIAENQDPLVFVAMIYAQRGDTMRAFDSLDKAVREREPYLEYLKVTNFFDPLRKESRYQAILQSLHFPD